MVLVDGAAIWRHEIVPDNDQGWLEAIAMAERSSRSVRIWNSRPAPHRSG